MISITELYEYIRFVTNKSQRGTSGLSPGGFNLIVPRAVDDVFKKYYGLPEAYQPGRPVPRIGYEQTQFITDAIRKQKNPPTQILVDGNGQAEYPEDYVHAGEIYYHQTINKGGTSDIKERPVDIVRDGWRSSRLDDSINHPTMEYPIASFYKDYILIDPKEVDHIFMTYLNYPERPEMVYSTTDDVLTFDSTASTDIDLPQHLFNDMASYILDDLGLNMSSQELKQYSEMYKQQGH